MNFLICTVPVTGHVAPGLAVARELVQRGHTVHWYTGRKFQAKIEAIGATFVPMLDGYDYDDSDTDAAFPERRNYKGIAKLRFDFKHGFIDAAVGQLSDIERHLTNYPADVLLADTMFMGARFIHEKTGILWAGYGITATGFNSRDTAPFGLALPPNASPIGHVRNRILNYLVNNIVFGDVTKHLDTVREKVGLPARKVNIFESLIPTHLYVQSSVPGFEYPRSDLSRIIHFVGPFLPDAPDDFRPPTWWPELTSGKPVVLLTQGTIATDSTELLVPAITALADEDVLVIATTGGKALDAFPVSPLPKNVRLEKFVPFAAVMPYVDVYVTNGGYGGVHFALAHGVPVVAAGKTEDKAEIGARVAWSGVGINLKTQTPQPEAVARAVKKVLADPRYRANAQRLQADIAAHNPPVEAADLLEHLATTRQPVVRSADVREMVAV